MPPTSSDKKPSSNLAVLGGFAVVIIGAALYLGIRQQAPIDLGRGTVTLGGSLHIPVDVASTPKAREQGLSGRDGLGQDEGMVFLFDGSARYAFWMKDMKFPIDIIWIRGKEVVDITSDVPVPAADGTLPTYSPHFPADTVLEVRAGFASRHGLRTGMPVAVSIDGKSGNR